MPNATPGPGRRGKRLNEHARRLVALAALTLPLTLATPAHAQEPPAATYTQEPPATAHTQKPPAATYTQKPPATEAPATATPPEARTSPTATPPEARTSPTATPPALDQRATTRPTASGAPGPATTAAAMDAAMDAAAPTAAQQGAGRPVPAPAPADTTAADPARAFSADATATVTGMTTTPRGTATAGEASAALQGRVALIGVPGLEWSDITQAQTPNLWRLMSEGASASLSTRTVPPPGRGITCPTAGWLTVSAGQRAGTPDDGCPAAPTPQQNGDGGVTIPGWDALTAYQSETGYSAHIGTLGQIVADGGGKVAAIGPGAALAAADKSGNIAKYAPTLSALGDPAPYSLIVFDVPDLAAAWAKQPLDAYGIPSRLPDAARRTAAAQADRRIGDLLALLPPGTTILLAGVSDVSPNAHLHVAIATGPSPDGTAYRHGHLTATSTRQDALVTINDLTATAIQSLGLTPPREVVGRPWQSGSPAPATPAEVAAELADEDLASQVLREVRGPFFTVLVAAQLLFYALAALILRRRRPTEPPAPTEPARPDSTTEPARQEEGASRAEPTITPERTATGSQASNSKVLKSVQVVAVVSGAIAVSTFLAQLIPWWTLPIPMLSVIVTILGIAVLITAVAFAGPWRAHMLGPLTVVAAVTSVALLLDVMTGSTLQVNAVSGYEPVTGGRFYGFSNIAFAIYSTGTILGLAGIAHWLLGKRVPRAVVTALCAAYGGFAVFADGWPSWGADFGGVPAFVVGLAVFLILLSGKRVSPLRLLLVGVAGAALVGALSVIDWLRPESQRTHLGAFVQQIIDGEAWTVVGRKFAAMVGVTVGNWSLTLLSLVALAFLFLVLARPSRWGVAALGLAYELAPTFRAGLFGALACALIGFLMNDSGIAIPAMALTVAVPLTLAACVRALQLATPTPPAPPSEPAAPSRSAA